MPKPAAATAIGDDLYLFRSPIPSEECLISAHGGTAGGNALFDVPAGVTVNFYTFHGFSLIDPGLDLERDQRGIFKLHEAFGGNRIADHGGANLLKAPREQSRYPRQGRGAIFGHDRRRQPDRLCRGCAASHPPHGGSAVLMLDL